MSIQIGDSAPNFTLIASDKSAVALSDFRDKKNVVLLFFPLAFSGVCTAELCATRDDIGTYESLEAQVLAVSVDSIFALEKFKEDQKINFPLLSDFNKTTAQAYGAYYEIFFGMQGVAKRAAFVIDKKGSVQYAEVLESADDLPNFEAIRKALSQLN